MDNDSSSLKGQGQEENNNHSASSLVCCILNNIGYSQPIVSLRRKSYRERDRLVNRFTEKYVRITGGSKAEGLSSCFESDYDRLNVYKNVVCICGQCECKMSDMETETAFLLNGDECHPGHFYLEPKRTPENGNNSDKPVLENTQDGVIISSLVEIDGAYLLSSDKFMYEHERDIDLDINGGWKKSIRTGPSVPSTRGLYRRDDVFAFRCPCQRHILAEWGSRHRKFGWPSHDSVKTFLDRDAYIVPVGCPGSEHRDLEWRICFAERVLLDSFNDSQLMLYVLLKMINSSVITPVCADLSSYVMKNITFWLSEGTPEEMFTQENLFEMVRLALQMLYKAVEKKHLPYYMLPDRNLLQGRINIQEQKALLEVIGNCVHDVHKLVLGLPKISKAWLKPINELKTQGEVRNELERLELFRQEIIAFYWRPNLKREEVDELCWQDARYKNARFEMYDIVWPEWKHAFSHENTDAVEDLAKPLTNESKDAFNERYLKFAESYYDIIWPHMKGSIKSLSGVDVDSIPRQKVIEIMAVMRLKIEQALA